MIYNIFYYIMLLGYLGVTIYQPDLKTKIIGIFLLLVNALIFRR